MALRIRVLAPWLSFIAGSCQLIGDIGERHAQDSRAAGAGGTDGSVTEAGAGGADGDIDADVDADLDADVASDACGDGAVSPAAIDASSNSYLGSVTFGGDPKATLRAMTVDPSSGDLTLLGDFLGSLDFGNCVPPLVADDGGDFFLARLDRDGKALWAKRLVTIDQPPTGTLASTTDGGIWLAGDLFGALQLGPNVSLQGNGVSQIFLAHFDKFGVADSTNKFATGYESSASSVVVLPDGSLGLVGAFQQNLGFGGSAETIYASGTHGYVAKLEPGALGVWAATAYPCNGHFNSVAPGTDGSLLVGGHFLGACDLGSGVTLPGLPPGSSDCLVARYDGGIPQWAFSIQGECALPVVAATPSGGVVFAGRALGGSPIFSDLYANDYDLFVVKLDKSGNHAWHKQLSAAGDDWPTGIAVDSNEDVFVVGAFAAGTIVTKLNGTNGSKIWTRPSLDPSPFAAPGPWLALDPGGRVNVAGMLRDAFDFGSGLVAPGAQPDIFVTQYAR